MSKMDDLAINSIKMLALDMINKAGSGHPGIVLGAAPIIYALYKEHLDVIPSNPNWINRDRFVMSAGHGSALLYSCLYHMGYNIEFEELKHFRQISRSRGRYGCWNGSFRKIFKFNCKNRR